MADITMCDNTECTLKDNCYRSRAIPNQHRQSYGFFKQDEKGECENFWDLRKKPDSWWEGSIA